MEKETNTARHWLQITDENLSVADLEARVEQNLVERLRAAAAADKTLEIPNFGASDVSLELPLDMPYLFQLIQHLKSAEKYYPQVEVDLVLSTSPATRLPLIGGLWQKVRHLAHELVVFYVNRFVTHQTQINYHLVNSLIELTDLNIKLTREVAVLKAEMTAGTAGEEGE